MQPPISNNNAAADSAFFSFGLPFSPLKEETPPQTGNLNAADPALFSCGQPISPMKEANPTEATTKAAPLAHLSTATQEVPVGCAQRPPSRHAPSKRIGRERRALGTLGKVPP